MYVWYEPLNYIDIYSRMQIENLIREFSPTMIFVEHDLAFRNTIATKTVYIESTPGQSCQWSRWTAHFMRRHWQPCPVLLCGYQGRQAPGVLACLLWFWVEVSGRNWPQIEANFDRYLQSPELLQTLVFCDTILILRKRGVPNNRWNINIIAKVFPVKSPQIHPYISEFAEWE